MTDPLAPRITVHRLHAWEMCGCQAQHEVIEGPDDTHVTGEPCGCPLRHERPVAEKPRRKRRG